MTLHLITTEGTENAEKNRIAVPCHYKISVHSVVRLQIAKDLAFEPLLSGIHPRPVKKFYGLFKLAFQCLGHC